MQVFERSALEALFQALKKRGFTLVGPTVRQGAIVYGRIEGVADLPIGWTDEQEGGTYRLKRRADEALFGFTVGPHSWKQFLHLPELRLWQARRTEEGFEVTEDAQQPPRLAFIAARSCELHAIAVQDRVFLGGPYTDRFYQARRENVFILAVQCGQAGNTCFCASMNTGPRAESGFDVALTEVLEGGRHYFAAECGTDLGREVLAEVHGRAAQEDEAKRAGQIVAETARQMGRRLDTQGIKELLYHNYEHPRWDEVASRCLTCGNCTLVCPTCFCTTVEDMTDLTGEHTERWRKWDSCFTMDFSYIHGGSVRVSAKSRYRQWMTHKLATWMDQFGTSGCVGCGRCITWCPVGIDITEETRAIREAPHEPPSR